MRIMTYNVHSCIGMDRRVAPERIARVIASYSPDIVALQELDVGRDRTHGLDQARMIADLLEMEFHFHPSLRIEEEQYGNAVLSRLPLRVVRAPEAPLTPPREPAEGASGPTEGASGPAEGASGPGAPGEVDGEAAEAPAR